jgi:hypothetical protein
MSSVEGFRVDQTLDIAAIFLDQYLVSLFVLIAANENAMPDPARKNYESNASLCQRTGES